jgi:hypothetical protein
VSLDVLKEAQGWLENANSVCDPGPEVSWVVLAESLPCGAEGLARVAARQDVHFAVKLGPREGLNIRPDRCWVQASRFHFCDQVRAGERFDLAKSDCSQIWDCSLESEINAAVPGAEANVCNWLGSIHVMCVVSLVFGPQRSLSVKKSCYRKVKLFSAQISGVKTGFRNQPGRFPETKMVSDPDFPGKNEFSKLTWPFASVGQQVSEPARPRQPIAAGSN